MSTEDSQRTQGFAINRKLVLAFFACLPLATFFHAREALAADISLNLNVSAADDVVTVSLTNTGRDPATDLGVKVELAGKTYEQPFSSQLAPKDTHAVPIKVALPPKEGSFPLFTTISYRNEGERLSLINVGYFHFRRTEELRTKGELAELTLSETGKLRVTYDKKLQFRLFLPDEILVEGTEELLDGRIYNLKNQLPTFQSSYQIFGVVENNDDVPVKASAIFSSRLHTQLSRQKGLRPKPTMFGPVYFALTTLLGFSFAFSLYRSRVLPLKKETPDRLTISLIRWSFSVFVVSLLFLGFYRLRVIPDHTLAWVQAHPLPDGPFDLGRWLHRALQVLLEWLYFEGGDYDGFARYVADPLYLYMLFGNFFVLYYLIKPNPATDKYWHLMLSTFSLILRPKGKKPHWSKYTKIAILTLMVKAFYVPLLTSWTANDAFHQYNLTGSLSWTFHSINAYVVALLIFIDVTVFAVGYIVELPQLKNQIKSVEPTLLGWIVCIMCYPPFNQFSFVLFDRQFPGPLDLKVEDQIFRDAAMFAITLLWGIYVWATIALGFRASNLTSRGIVMKGPYAFVRHPAYISKVSLWWVEGIILDLKHFGLMFTLTIVYLLRAWTEERHLEGSDSDYTLYKRKVRWKFIPRVY